jgi:hypothetical protein
MEVVEINIFSCSTFIQQRDKQKAVNADQILNGPKGYKNGRKFAVLRYTAGLLKLPIVTKYRNLTQTEYTKISNYPPPPPLTVLAVCFTIP